MRFEFPEGWPSSYRQMADWAEDWLGRLEGALRAHAESMAGPRFPMPGDRWELWCGCQVDLGAAADSVVSARDPFHAHRRVEGVPICPRLTERLPDGFIHARHELWHPDSTPFRRWLGESANLPRAPRTHVRWFDAGLGVPVPGGLEAETGACGVREEAGSIVASYNPADRVLTCAGVVTCDPCHRLVERDVGVRVVHADGGPR